MKLTIGMAVFDDFDGVYFTVQAIRMYHKEVLDRLELLVVDNNPTSKSAHHLKGLADGWKLFRYVPMAEAQGTTQPRNRVFQEATGDAVMCVDSHVLLAPGSLSRLLAFFEKTNFNGLVQGPMLYDDLQKPNTHFDDFWRAEMWGIWGNAWACSCSNPTHFTILRGPDDKCVYAQLLMGLRPINSCERCGKPFPTIPYDAHEPALKSRGFVMLGETDSDTPFDIPGQGLGLFACQKKDWLGFNPHMRGFGGEEMYIHEKYRKAGRRAVCLPFLKWAHRFGRPSGAPYPAFHYNKIRNYVLGFNEIGRPLDEIHRHFVTDLKKMPQHEWDFLVEDPVNHDLETAAERAKNLPQPITATGSGGPQPRATIESHAELMAWCKSLPRDLDQHLDALAEYAAKCQHVTEITHRRESTVGLLATPGVLVSYQAEWDPLIQRLLDIFPKKLQARFTPIGPLPNIESTEMLFLDTIGNSRRLMAELHSYKNKVSRFIAVHDTTLYSEQGENEQTKGTGLLTALRAFMKEHPEWSVLYHTTKQYGLTVIGKDPTDKPALPSSWTMAANFTKALAEYATHPGNVSKEEYEKRLETCTLCDQRNNNNCSVCGCNLSTKALAKVWDCPLGKWPPVSSATPEN